MRIRPRSMAVLAAALAVAACGNDDGGSVTNQTAEEQSTQTTTETAGDASEQERESDEEQLEQSCTNSRAGLRIRYPEGWHADAGCEWFHPREFDLPRNQDVVSIAIHVREEPISLERAASGDPMTEVLSRERETVQGREAIRTETRLTERGLMPAGTRGLHWTIRRNEQRSIRASTFSVGAHDFDESRRVLDSMVDALQIQEQ